MTRPSAPRVAALCLWLGLVGFGGGFVVAQRIRRALVEERGWIDEQTFSESFGVACALPGTTAPNLLAILGLRLGGAAVSVGAVAAFLAPSVAAMIAFGAIYDRVRGVATLSQFLDGMAAATVGVVAAVAVDLGKGALARALDWLIALGAAAALVTRALNLLEVMAIAALVGALFRRPPRAPTGSSAPPPSTSPLHALAVPEAAALALPASLALFAVFARIGLVTFGGGFAMIPAIEHEVVRVHGWLGESAFNDAMVLGQITPGPVAIAATFIGFRVGGLSGAALATLGMFVPPFLLALAAGRSLEAFRASPPIQGALRGVAPAVVGVIAAAAVALYRTSVHSIAAGAVAAVALALLVAMRKLSPLAPLAGGGLVFVAIARLG